MLNGPHQPRFQEPLLADIKNDLETNAERSRFKTLEKLMGTIPIYQQVKICLALSMVNAAEALEVVSIGYIINSFTQDGERLTHSQKALVTAAVFIGMLVGGLVFGRIADSFGRRRCLFGSLWLSIISGLCSAFAPSVTILACLRVLGGFGIGGVVPSIFTLGAELFPPKQRKPMLNIVASFYMLGSLLGALLAWVVLGDVLNWAILPWKVYLLVCQLFCACLACWAYLVIPESPRYLLRKGDLASAMKVLHALTSKTIGNEDLMELLDSVLDDTAKSGISLTTSLKMIKEHQGIIFALVWFTLSYGSYGVLTWNNVIFADLGLRNPYVVSLIFSFSDLPGNILSVVLVGKVGQKALLGASMLLASVFALVFGLLAASCSTHDDSKTAAGCSQIGWGKVCFLVCSACLFEACSVAGWNVLDAISTETFPSAVRTFGMGTVSAFGRAGSLLAQVINGYLEANIPLLLLCTSGTMFIGGFSAFLLKSTNSQFEVFWTPRAKVNRVHNTSM